MAKISLQTILYTDYERDLPQEGSHILGQLRAENIIVYQAFRPEICQYAVEHQKFGGDAYSFSRMSWIKPNFLWMMYRAGWASKAHQQHILAIEISLEHFRQIYQQAVNSSYLPQLYPTQTDWKAALETSNVRMQWDPDHAPKGAKLARRAVQLGLRGSTLRQFATDWIVSIEDITPFVRQQAHYIHNNQLQYLEVIKEQVIIL
jgi:hypothetical protein